MKLLAIVTLVFTNTLFANEVNFLSVIPFSTKTELNWKDSVIYVGSEKMLMTFASIRNYSDRSHAPFEGYKEYSMLIIEFVQHDDKGIQFQTFRKPIAKSGETTFTLLNKKYTFSSMKEFTKQLEINDLLKTSKLNN